MLNAVKHLLVQIRLRAFLTRAAIALRLYRIKKALKTLS